MAINTEFATEGELEVWEFNSMGRRRVTTGLEPDMAVEQVGWLTESQQQQQQMRKDLGMPDPPGGPKVYKIVEHVEERRVWEP